MPSTPAEKKGAYPSSPHQGKIDALEIKRLKH